MAKGSLKWGLFALAALLLWWRVVTVNVAQHLAAEDNLAAATWNADIPDILLMQAAQAVEADPSRAGSLALRAAWENPADGRAFMILAMLWERQGKLELAKKAIAIVDFMTPRRPENQLQAGNFWARRGDMDQALQHWSVAMQMKPDLTKKLFPELLRVAETPRYRPAFKKIIGEAPSWWDSFFLYAAANAANLDTLKAVYLGLEKGARGPGEGVRKAYLDRLMREGMWTEAYFVWMNSLDAGQLSGLGNVYDGGFEQDAPEEGYGWRFAAGDSLSVAAQSTYGASGKRALRVEFLGSRPVPARLASQFLMLDPGQYQFSGRARVDSLQAVRGLKWVVSCASGAGTVLAESERLVESAPWKSFSVAMRIPETGCEAQKIELFIDPADARKTDLTGSVWFDDVALSLMHAP